MKFDENIFLNFFLQTITGAMSTLTPPISLEKPENQARVDYIQDFASSMFLLNDDERIFSCLIIFLRQNAHMAKGWNFSCEFSLSF